MENIVVLKRKETVVEKTTYYTIDGKDIVASKSMTTTTSRAVPTRLSRKESLELAESLSKGLAG